MKAFFDTIPAYVHIYDSNLNLVDFNMYTNANKKLSERDIGKNILELNPNLAGSIRYEKYLNVLRDNSLIGFDDYVRMGGKIIRISISAFKVGDNLALMMIDHSAYVNDRNTSDNIKQNISLSNSLNIFKYSY